MPEEPGASEQQTPQATDAEQMLQHPIVIEALARVARESQEKAFATAEADWQRTMETRDKENTKKLQNQAQERDELQAALDRAEGKLAAAKLSDDQEAIANARAQLAALERKAKGMMQQGEDALAQAALGQTALEMFLDALPKPAADALRAVQEGLSRGEKTYRLMPKLQDAIAQITQASGNGTHEPASREPATAGLRTNGASEPVTADNIDKLYLAGKVPDDKYRAFLQSGKL